MPQENKTLLAKAQRVQKIAKMLCLELDELICALKDPSALHAELKGRSTEIADKFDKVLDMLIEIKENSK